LGTAAEPRVQSKTQLSEKLNTNRLKQEIFTMVRVNKLNYSFNS